MKRALLNPANHIHAWVKGEGLVTGNLTLEEFPNTDCKHLWPHSPGDKHLQVHSFVLIISLASPDLSENQRRRHQHQLRTKSSRRGAPDSSAVSPGVDSLPTGARTSLSTGHFTSCYFLLFQPQIRPQSIINTKGNP